MDLSSLLNTIMVTTLGSFRLVTLEESLNNFILDLALVSYLKILKKSDLIQGSSGEKEIRILQGPFRSLIHEIRHTIIILDGDETHVGKRKAIFAGNCLIIFVWQRGFA